LSQIGGVRNYHSRLPSLAVVACRMGLALASIVCAAAAASQSRLTIRRVLTWSQPGTEIDSVSFSPDGKFIATVSRAHEADGDEAEGLPESYFRTMEERNRKNPRFADPVIKMIDLKGETVCEVSFGWNPSISPDDKELAYSRQVKPITGLRVLAETEAGNDIQLFDCKPKESRHIAGPDKGYLDNPLFVEDGGALVYTQNEAVNGAFAGAIGVQRFDLRLNRESTLLRQNPVAATPCPPRGTPEQTHDSIICSQATNRTTQFFPLIFQIDCANNQLRVPLPSLPDLYMANQYDMNLVSLAPVRKLIFPFGKIALARTNEVSFQLASAQRVLVFSGYWKILSASTGIWLPDVGPKNTKQRSLYSPDLKYYLSFEPQEDSDHFVLYETKTGMALVTFPRGMEATGASWSSDSKHFAIVMAPRGAGGLNYHENLIVYAIP
jgi:WD40 repeat protein